MMVLLKISVMVLLLRITHLFSQDPMALRIIGYYDEQEVCNPLGTHIKKHKVGVVFFTLGNIHPRFRSTFRAINLAILATKPVLEKHGIDAVFYSLSLTIVANSQTLVVLYS
jgi:hypothetical protein